jgi:hypothetical protein
VDALTVENGIAIAAASRRIITILRSIFHGQVRDLLKENKK